MNKGTDWTNWSTDHHHGRSSSQCCKEVKLMNNIF